MSARLDYCKRLMKKAFIIQNNLGKNEKKGFLEWLDEVGEDVADCKYVVDDATPCECEARSDVVAFNDKKYCCDCLHYIEDKKDE